MSFKRLICCKDSFSHCAVKFMSRQSTTSSRASTFKAPKPTLDLDYLGNPENAEEIHCNIVARKGVGCIKSFSELLKSYNMASPEEKPVLLDRLTEEGLKIPNQSDSRLASYGETPKVVEERGIKPRWSFTPREFHEIANNLDLLRTENLGNITGSRSYYFIKELVQLEQALIHFTVDTLMKKGFTLYSVPDLLHSKLIESCGMDTQGERTQVYRLDERFGDGSICLSGTAEMALASYFSGQDIAEERLPIRMAAVSRCFRAETSNVPQEKGIYRVHQFTKVEMFGLTRGQVTESDALLDELVGIQRELFDRLGYFYQILDMPLHELGAPAYRKFDIEAWMPGRNMYGEISSASNCTDYQSRRLDIRSIDPVSGERRFVHTVNGTACAVPRSLITLLEMGQREDGQVDIPKELQPYCNGLQRLTKPQKPFKLKWIKSKSYESTKNN